MGMIFFTVLKNEVGLTQNADVTIPLNSFENPSQISNPEGPTHSTKYAPEGELSR